MGSKKSISAPVSILIQGEQYLCLVIMRNRLVLFDENLIATMDFALRAYSQFVPLVKAESELVRKSKKLHEMEDDDWYRVPKGGLFFLTKKQS